MRSPRRSTDSPKYPYDVDAAKKLVEEAGATGKEIVIATARSARLQRRSPRRPPAAAESIGLKAKIKTITPNAYTALFTDPSARAGIDLFFTAWYLSIADPMEMYGVLRTGEFSNYGGWSRPDVRRRRQRGDRDRRPGRAFREDRRGPADRERPAARGCRSTPHRRRCLLGKRITGVAAVDRLPVLPVGGHHWRSVSGERRRGACRPGGRAAAWRRFDDRRPPGARQARLPAPHALPRVAARSSSRGSSCQAIRSASCCAAASRPRRRSPTVTEQYGLDLPALAAVPALARRRAARRLRSLAAVPRRTSRTVIGERLPMTLGLVDHGRADHRGRRARRRHRRRALRGRMLDRAVLVGLTVLAAIPSFVGVDRAHLGLRGPARLVPVVRLRRRASSTRSTT